MNPSSLPRSPRSRDVSDALDRRLLAFAPLHKSALGVATGVVAGAVVFIATAWAIVLGVPPDLMFRLRFLLPLHAVTWPGAVLGGLSAGFAFFVAGWFLAFCRNGVLAASVWIARTRAELDEVRDFLDHI